MKRKLPAFAAHLWTHEKRYPELRRPQRESGFGGHHANDRIHFATQFEVPSDDGGVSRQMATPEGIAQNDFLATPNSFFARGEVTPAGRLDAHGGEEICSDFYTLGFVRLLLTANTGTPILISGQLFKAV